ncbi:uncharacterized protein E0L32_011106 [Thyridium curvatum]|uniref:non-specific serine/threonine protein kinase n=1 Tax=Thyridium curvatum TaxID=1093900 RepID=A0A507AQ45_9PEZI|nr:uncharacterized protein E0L32_011106 [Thyridium curvatum]TPX06961.1 hypothetical protein E0L32_011106 [Thyridium curvatum]
MGQGFSLTTPSAGSAGIDVPELSDLVYEKSIGSARFLKSIRARHHDGVVLVKVLIKPYMPMALREYKRKILHERKILAEIPNALGYQRVIETETNGYLVRQFLYNSLYDRLSTRPFLEDIEKKWLAFQLLCALRDCHSRDVYHGDIKTENTLVTSWNWLYLSDFSSAFKPVMLPDDNPADFSYFFDTSGRRTCYLAPERFVAPGEDFDPDAKVTWAMDVFSAGCVIAELFLESPIFSLSQLYKYRRGEYDPAISHLSRIPDKDLREMIASMIQLDPQKRYSAEEYLVFWRKKVFPDYFFSFLHQYMEVITDPSSGQYPVSGATRNLGEADERIDRVFYDFDKISYFLGYQDDRNSAVEQIAPRLGLGHFPVRLNIPNNEHYVSAAVRQPGDDGTLIFLTLIVSSLRNTARSASKIRACDVLLAFAERLTDEAKLDRVLPYLMTLLNDKADMVVVAAVRTITQLLSLIKLVSPVNSHVFLEYILPRMQVVLVGGSERPSALVRATYASCLGNLATSASRFLDIAATLKGDSSLGMADPEVEPGSGVDTAFDRLFDDAQQDLIELFEQHTKILIEDPDPYVRRAFLSSVPELCMFFGTAAANDIILTHLNTYLNDRDWMLKCAFFDAVVGIASFLGNVSLERFFLPLMIQVVTDPEEHVVHAALHSLAELANLGLLSKASIWNLVEHVARFTMHPNIWIRESAAMFIAAAGKYLSPADKRCMLLPLVAPYLTPDIIPEFTELSILDSLKRPLPRPVYDQVLMWAMKTDRGVFWKSVSKARGYLSGSPLKGRKDIASQSLSKVARNEEDEQWLNRLRNLGLASEDEFKLMVLREYIWRLSRAKPRDNNEVVDSGQPQPGNIIPLRALGITPQTVLFDEEPPKQASAMGIFEPENPPRSIEDALQDASMTIDDPLSKRKRAAFNTHRSRLSSQQAISPSPTDGRRSLNEELASPTSNRLLSPDSSRDTSRRSSAAQGKAPARDAADGDVTEETPYSARRTIRHQSSAISLLNRKDSAKSGPETGTTETNAFGQVEGPFAATPHARSPVLDDNGTEAGRLRFRSNHTYPGNDPSVLKMLDNMYADNYPHDIAEFGPLVTPVSRRRASRLNGQSGDELWRPSGKLVATFSEHTGAINRVVPSPDHLFFITGGDDGCVKVWDTHRLERNITHRARQTHRHEPGARVLALCFIENTHCFISCASDGSVHVVKVECTSASGASSASPSSAAASSTTSPRYNKLRLLREYQLPEGERAVWCEHFKQEAASVLVLATDRSRVLGIDLRTMTLLFVLDNPVRHGTPTCLAVDRRRNWLVLGTSHGVLDLWDLRFRMRLKGWGLPGKQPVYRLAVHPVKGRGKWLCVAGGTGQGGEVTVWDLEKTLCREVYRVGGVGGGGGSSSNKDGGPRGGYEAWDVDEDKPEGMLGRFATNIVDPPPPTTSGGGGSTPAAATDRGVRAMAVGAAAPPDEQARDVRHAFIVTGGSDKKLRFWDLARVENSAVYSGLAPEEGRPTYAAGHPTTAMTVNTERPARAAGTTTGGGGGGKSAGSRSSSAAAAAAATTPGAPGGGSGSGSATPRPPRSTVISLQQQQLLRSHLDSILDVAVLESPYSMTVSVDRMGVAFVFS